MQLHNIKADFNSSKGDHIFVTDFVKDNFYSVGLDHNFLMDIIYYHYQIDHKSIWLADKTTMHQKTERILIDR